MGKRRSWLALGAVVVTVGCGSSRAAPSIDASADAPSDGSLPEAGTSLMDAPADAAGGTTAPTLQVGYDAYRHWDLLPLIRLGVRTYMRSTYDRAGGNEAADASHYLREVAPGDDVPLDVEGAGVSWFFRANRWHGSPWGFVIDGTANVVADTATSTPNTPPATSTFIPPGAFPAPLALTYAATQGADVSWVPMGFSQSFMITHGHSDYGTGYYVYSLFDPGAPLSQPISAWSENDSPPSDVLGILASAGTDTAPSGAGVSSLSGTISLPASGAVTIADLTGPSTVRVLRLTVPAAAQAAVESARLSITWDGRASASVDAPIPLFFGTGTLFNRNSAEYLVKSLPAVVRLTSTGLELSMYFPMPFQESAHIALTGGGTSGSGIGWQLRTVPLVEPPGRVAYFHATYADHGTPVAGSDLVFLDTTEAEGGGDWCGSFVGTSFIFSDDANLTTLEGDPRFFFDDGETPQGMGTGTEEWGAGGDYWNGGVNTTLALAGHPVGAPSAASAMGPQDEIESAYRFLIADSFPFGKNARIQLEHGGEDDSTEHYRSVAYWYGLPGACLTMTDSLHVSDAMDEAAHGYTSPTASSIDTLTSRYEWGVDHVGATEIYPATTDTGRHMAGASEFTLAIRPDNFGVLLRRKLDYGFADQRASVFVADATAGAAFTFAGTWYLAGSNTCAFVDSPTETGTTSPVLETSNRQWRDDEFLLPSGLTAGRAQIRVRIVFAPRVPAAPVAPGEALGTRAWSEYRYAAYSYVLPNAQ
jgi:hypothetical protein